MWVRVCLLKLGLIAVVVGGSRWFLASCVDVWVNIGLSVVLVCAKGDFTRVLLIVVPFLWLVHLSFGLV